MNKQKGFTIIELIVVIAIIAVLAGIVLVNVTGYINKGKDAAAQSNLDSMMTSGVVFYDANSTYTNFYSAVASPITTAAGCVGSTGFISACQALINAGYTTPGITVTCAGAACNAAGVTGWCAQITLKNGGNTFCVDSTGNKLNKASGTCVAGVCG
jgi:prepilin-type N-terminal cleavage/methylation domain-containing protein